MSQDNIQTDTPVEGNQTEEVVSLEEAVFGDGFNEGSDVIDKALPTDEGTQEVEQAAPEQGQPVEVSNNDEKRFQYWQSQADKAKNENVRLRQTLASQSQQNVANQRQPQPQQAQQPVAQEAPIEEFPAPPEKPSKPAGFSREEAFTDPSSQSAQYIESVEQWRDDMTEYGQIKSQYDSAVQQERLDSIERERVQNIQRAQAYQVKKNQAREIIDYVQGNHGMSQDEAVDFMKTMSDPSSISTDNLVQLYRMQKGGVSQPTNTQPTNTQPVAPSQNFQQVQRAQQVPSPMGVMPSGQTNVDGKSMEDKIMDTIIGDFNDKNPWK